MFRQATAEDLNVVASWIRSPRDCEFWAGSAMSYPLRLDTLADNIHLSPATSFCLFDNSVIAFGQLFDKGNGRGHLAKIIVDPDTRTKGYGSELIRQLVNVAVQRDLSVVGLNVQFDNGAAIKLYKKLGFEMSPRPQTLNPAPDSHYMICDLTKQWSRRSETL